LQVDEYHRAKAAAVIDYMFANTEPKDEKSETTDTRMTPRVNSEGSQGDGQSQKWRQAFMIAIVAKIAAVGFEPTTLGL
jgi:hypothetical protein